MTTESDFFSSFFGWEELCPSGFRLAFPFTLFQLRDMKASFPSHVFQENFGGASSRLYSHFPLFFWDRFKNVSVRKHFSCCHVSENFRLFFLPFSSFSFFPFSQIEAIKQV
ncbi:hypothetical protein CDAR_488091 [Caerostris darwini]|uniref:Uncharacterized protein n=1 Tax=Caerostris darwini TaxID=1538125 RepID=A0AAV4MDM3_9ARAC|nr:hypothetical protein CDAR_488091 [Caerostris darwini]